MSDALKIEPSSVSVLLLHLVRFLMHQTLITDWRRNYLALKNDEKFDLFSSFCMTSDRAKCVKTNAVLSSLITSNSVFFFDENELIYKLGRSVHSDWFMWLINLLRCGHMFWKKASMKDEGHP